MYVLEIVIFVLCVFFFKQKTAYELRISDLSSDVCSSDLLIGTVGSAAPALGATRERRKRLRCDLQTKMAGPRPRHLLALPGRGCRALARLLRCAVADEVVGGRGDLAAFLAGGILAEIILLCEIRLVRLRGQIGSTQVRTPLTKAHLR